jgi:hypothetical protein
VEWYRRKATVIGEFAERPEHYSPMLHAHFHVVLEAIAAGATSLFGRIEWATSTTTRCANWSAPSISGNRVPPRRRRDNAIAGSASEYAAGIIFRGVLHR